MIETLNQIDTQIFLLFNGLHCAFFDRFMWLFTSRFIWVPMYATILYMLLRNYDWRRALVYTLAIALTITLADQLCASIIRPAFERLRPSNLANPLSEWVHIVNGYRGGRCGFPSCHGANSFGLAVILALIFRRRRFTLFIFGWAALNSYSRLYLGVHYPGDLLVGALIGSTIAVGCYWLGRAVADRLDRRAPLSHRAPRPSATITIPFGLRIENMVIRVRAVTIPVSDVMILAGVATLVVIVAASV